MTVVSENAKAIRKTLADNLENEFKFITHTVRTYPTHPTKRLVGIHMTLRTCTNCNTPSYTSWPVSVAFVIVASVPL